MKRLFIVLVLSLFAALTAYTQSSPFRMVGTASWTTINPTTYQGTINFQSDLTGMGFLATQIVDSFKLITPTVQIFQIDSVGSLTFSSAFVRIVRISGSGAPIGQVMVYNPDGKQTIPQCPFGSTGSTAQLQAAINTYNASLAVGIDSTSYRSDSAFIYSNSTEYFTGITDAPRPNNGRVWYVSKSNPNCSASAVVGDPTRPFCNPWQAVDSLQKNDIVKVEAYNFIYGDTSCTECEFKFVNNGENLWKTDSVTWIFSEGVKFTNPASSGGVRLFKDTLGYYINIKGHAVFDITSKNGIVQAYNYNTRIHIEGEKYIANDETGWGQAFHMGRFKEAIVNIKDVDITTYTMFYTGQYGGTDTLDGAKIIWSGRKLLDDKSDGIMRVDGATRNCTYLVDFDEIEEDYAFDTWIFGRYYMENNKITIRFKNSLIARETENTIFGAPWSGAYGFLTLQLVGGGNEYNIDMGNSTLNNLSIIGRAFYENATVPNTVNIRFRGKHSGTTNNFLKIINSSTKTLPAYVNIDANVVSNMPLVDCTVNNPVNYQLTGRYLTTTAATSVAQFSAANTKFQFVDAVLVNDGTVPAVSSTIARSVNFLSSATNSTLIDVDVTEEITPLIRNSNVK